ncbi:hypothetical protein [Pedobacter sandarakinus]|uniref:hypothetical protein n=1 Tax=Pedobacter sandarakinus TaxID=353156 RepID=UPI0022476709|nr:hypothetical protein [Pedobacter sandarakinus]MCX2574531.1 hypothetical protein [Pedobacter sandarakinus]
MEDLQSLFSNQKPIKALEKILRQYHHVFGYYRNQEGLLIYNERITNKTQIKYLLHAQSGSLLLLYNMHNEQFWDNAVIIYNDSSGDPTAIVAKCLNDYISLLFYGDGLISEGLTAASLHRLVPQVYKSPPEVISQEKITSIAAYTSENYAYFPMFKAILVEQGFKPIANPINYIWDAMNITDSLSL